MPAIDAELSVIFTVIVALDAVMTVPANMVVFRRALFGEWRATGPSDRARLEIVAPFSPLQMGVSVPLQRPDGARELEAFRARYAGSARTVRLLQALGLLELILLILVVPSAVATYAGIGLLAALAATLLTCALGAAVAFRQWTLLNSGSRPPVRRLLAWCSPFSAPRAAEDVLRETFNGASAATTAHLMLSPRAFAIWIRPWAYDHLRRAETSQIDGLLTHAELDAIVQRPPDMRDSGAASYCPRCGQSWAIAAGHCNGCDVALVAVEVAKG